MSKKYTKIVFTNCRSSASLMSNLSKNETTYKKKQEKDIKK